VTDRAEGRRPDPVPAYDASTYGERIAAVYDDWPRLPTNTASAVEFLAAVAGRGPILELGVGTGRPALPLVERGFTVHGIDASPAMVQKLRGKPRGDRIAVVMGDFADMAIAGRFSLIFVAFNTFFGLSSQDDQLRCFAGVAEHLADDGLFVIEAFVPDLSRFDRGQRVGVTEVGADTVYLETGVHDPVSQRIRSQQIVISARGVQLYPVQVRYAWPSELDLMARLAGLRLRERWASWGRQPFVASSGAHVSVYQRAVSCPEERRRRIAN
jgi:SAM-dependent methyltransferase